jgi:hypothetical protein
LFLLGQDTWPPQPPTLTIDYLSGSYKGGILTNQVDVVYNTDCDGDPGTIDPEFFSDHFALADFRNTGSSNIFLTRYEVHYSPLDTVTAPYPIPSPVIIDLVDPFLIPLCEYDDKCPTTRMDQLYFVPIETKALLRSFWEDSGYSQLFYDCRYVFMGENELGEPISAEAQFYFYVADYDYCD